MIFFKRQFATFVLIFMGFLVLSGHFINNEPLQKFINEDATQWYEIIAGFAAFLGVLNLLKLHFNKISYKKKNWKYSILTLISFFIMIFFGFIYKGTSADPFIDLNGNGKYDSAELYVYDYDNKEDCLSNNNAWDNIFGNCYIDSNNNDIWDNEESFTDILGNSKYDDGEDYNDSNNNGEWNKPELFIDKPDGKYTAVKWGAHLKDFRSPIYWIWESVYQPLTSTMFALLAFFVASASYRAFRIRNFEATLLLVSGVLLMLGRVPIGALIPWYLVTPMYVSFLFVLVGHIIKDRKVYFISFIILNMILFIMGFIFNWHLSTPPFLSIPLIQEWIFAVPATAGARALMIGIALGTVAQSFRIITGREKTILGD